MLEDCTIPSPGSLSNRYLNLDHVPLIAPICEVAADGKVVKVVGALKLFDGSPRYVDY